jgi:hypothetical protein
VNADSVKLWQPPATKLHELAQGGNIERAEPIILIGDCGTGTTRLLTGLCVTGLPSEEAHALRDCSSSPRGKMTATGGRWRGGPGRGLYLVRNPGMGRSCRTT